MARRDPTEERISREITRYLLTQNEPIIAFLKSKIKEHLDAAQEYTEELEKYERLAKAEEEPPVIAETFTDKGKPSLPRIVT